MRGTAAAAVTAAPDAKRFRHEEPERWAEARDAAAASGSADWMEGSTPVVQLSNNAQMKMEKICTKCGAEGHCVQDGCPGAAAAAPRPEFLRVQPEAGPAPVPFAHWGRPAQPVRAAEPEPQPSAPPAAPTGEAFRRRAAELDREETAPLRAWPPAGLPDVPQARAADRVGTWGADQTQQRDALARRVRRCPGCGRDLDVRHPYAEGLVNFSGSNNFTMQVKCGRCKRLLAKERTFWRAAE